MNTPSTSPHTAIPPLLENPHRSGGLLAGAENADQPVDMGLIGGVPVRQWRALKLLLDDLEITPDEVRQLANVRAEMAKWASIEGDPGAPEITDLGGTGRILVVIGHKEGGQRSEFERLFNLECNMASMVVVNGHVYKDNWRGRRRSDRIEYQKKREEMAGIATVATVRNKPLTPEDLQAIIARAKRHSPYHPRWGADDVSLSDLSERERMVMVDIPRLLARLEVLEARLGELPATSALAQNPHSH